MKIRNYYNNAAKQSISGRAIKELLGDVTVELVQVHSLRARLNLLVPGLQTLNALFAGRVLGPVRLQDGVPNAGSCSPLNNERFELKRSPDTEVGA